MPPAAPPSPHRLVARAVRARELVEGAGVLVRRTVGTPGLRALDPFVMLDHICSSVAAAKQGFPTHPHRGQTTVSVMLRGGMAHEDSMGNRGVVRDGGVQVMRAGAGVLHSEFPTAPSVSAASALEPPSDDEEEGGGSGAPPPPPPPEIEGFQLWVNLPARLKRAPPGYQDVDAERIPTAELRAAGPAGGAGPGAVGTARVIAGRLHQRQAEQGSAAGAAAAPLPPFVEGPVRLVAPPDQVLLLDVLVPAGASARVPVQDAFAGFAYVYRAGAGARLGGADAPARHALVLSDPPPPSSSSSSSCSDVVAEAGADRPLRFLLAAGRPIGEPVVQHGPFVMNTREEIEQAFREYSDGTFLKDFGEGFDPFAVVDGAPDAAADAARDEL